MVVAFVYQVNVMCLFMERSLDKMWGRKCGVLTESVAPLVTSHVALTRSVKLIDRDDTGVGRHELTS